MLPGPVGPRSASALETAHGWTKARPPLLCHAPPCLDVIAPVPEAAAAEGVLVLPVVVMPVVGREVVAPVVKAPVAGSAVTEAAAGWLQQSAGSTHVDTSWGKWSDMALGMEAGHAVDTAVHAATVAGSHLGHTAAGREVSPGGGGTGPRLATAGGFGASHCDAACEAAGAQAKIPA